MVISIHALRKEGDYPATLALPSLLVFLSTPSVRRATFHICGSIHCVSKFLSTPSARRATVQALPRPQPTPISIHALREEGDAEKLEINIGTMQFLSTPSARRATDGDTASIRLLGISIHALRKEGDMSWPLMPLARLYFYPRPPQGG